MAGLGVHANVQLCGGVSQTLEAVNDECRQLVAQYKSSAEQLLGRTFSKWEAVSMRTQVVAGVNYFVKVDAGDEFVHLRIYAHFNDASQNQLAGAQGGKTHGSPLEYF